MRAVFGTVLFGLLILALRAGGQPPEEDLQKYAKELVEGTMKHMQDRFGKDDEEVAVGVRLLKMQLLKPKVLELVAKNLKTAAGPNGPNQKFVDDQLAATQKQLKALTREQVEKAKEYLRAPDWTLAKLEKADKEEITRLLAKREMMHKEEKKETYLKLDHNHKVPDWLPCPIFRPCDKD